MALNHINSPIQEAFPFCLGEFTASGLAAGAYDGDKGKRTVHL
jgi:hypothetical protein